MKSTESYPTTDGEPLPSLPVVYDPKNIRYYEHFDPFALFIVSAAVLSFSIFSYLSLSYISDESFHANMIKHMLHQGWQNLPDNVTTPPYFHAFIAFFTGISGVQDNLLGGMRTVQFALCLLAIPAFYHIAKTLQHTNCDVRTLLCLLLPINLPLIGLVYTDTPALAMTALMILCTLHQRHWLALLFAVLGMGIRQMTVIWACFCAVYVIIDFYERQDQPLWASLKRFKLALRLFVKLIPYILAGAVFIAYSYFNQGVVAGDRDAHSVSFNASNAFMWLLVSFVLLLPYVIENTGKCWNLLIFNKWIWALLGGMFIVYLAFYHITHIYNQGHLWWLHNRAFAFTSQPPLHKLLFFIPIAWMALTYIQIALDSRKPWQLFLLYSFALLSFVPMPLVAFRYYIVAIALFLLWKPKSSVPAERAMLMIYLVLGLYAVYGTSKTYFFV